MEIPDKTDMGYMCSHANLCDMETLDISSLDTSEVIRMSYMFGFCENLLRSIEIRFSQNPNI